MIPDITLTTGCFYLGDFNKDARSLDAILENVKPLLAVPCYLHIFCNSVLYESLKTIRDSLGEEEELISKGYFKEDGSWKKPKDKVVKWILPVEEDGDDCVITFPEDLLEQTGWKEGDTLQWIDQGDGSFKMIKTEN